LGQPTAGRLPRSLVEERQPIAIDLLQALHGAGELALGHALRSLEANPPAQRGLPIEWNEVRKVVALGSVPVRERTAGVDQRWVDLERAEQQVDRGRYTGRNGSRRRVLRRSRYQPVA
jgi:hypothetical protein